MIVSYRDLTVWQRAMELVEATYLLSAKLPQMETFGLASQLQRSAVSVPSNIAEGHARDSTKEFLRFVSIALGSLAELETQSLLCIRLKFLTEQDAEKILTLSDEVGKMLRVLQKRLRERTLSASIP